MGDYFTYLLIDRPDGNAIRRLLTQSLDQNLNQLDVRDRPRIWLEARDEAAILAAESEADMATFFSSVESATELGQNGLPVLCMATREELALLVNREFLYGGGRYRIRRPPRPSRLGDLPDPYAHRMLHFVGAGAQADPLFNAEAASGGYVLPTEVRVGRGTSPPHARLLVAPQRIELTRAGAEAVCNRGLVEPADVVFLPPVRVHASNSYFDRRYVSVRDALRVPILRGGDLAPLPAAVRLWLLVDAPLLRDVLLDGGAIRFDIATSGAGRIRLHVRDADPVSHARAQMLLGPDADWRLEWMNPLAAALRGDVETLVPECLDIRASAAPVDWTVHTPSRRSEHSSNPEGNYQKFERLRDHLADDPNLRVTLEEGVLWPARLSTIPGRYNDHALAEECFIDRLWRCPWSAATDGAWHGALVADLLDAELVGVRHTLEQRVESWAAEERTRARLIEYPAGACRTIQCAWELDDETFEMMRLLAPMGTRFARDRVIHLDRGDQSLLDSEYQLG